MPTLQISILNVSFTSRQMSGKLQFLIGTVLLGAIGLGIQWYSARSEEQKNIRDFLAVHVAVFDEKDPCVREKKLATIKGILDGKAPAFLATAITLSKDECTSQRAAQQAEQARIAAELEAETARKAAEFASQNAKKAKASDDAKTKLAVAKSKEQAAKAANEKNQKEFATRAMDVMRLIR